MKGVDIKGMYIIKYTKVKLLIKTREIRRGFIEIRQQLTSSNDMQV